MSKHTPGPWTTNGASQNSHADAWKSNPPSVNSATAPIESSRIADVSIYRKDEGEVKANARLIAAAPDLLEAAKALVEDFDGQGVPLSRSALDFRALRFAIAKAEGES